MRVVCCLQYIYNMVRLIKSERLEWGGHIVRIEEGREIFEILTSKLTGK